MSEPDEQNKSVGWVAGMLALVVLYFGWTFLASDYFTNTPGDGRGEVNIWVNSVEQLSNFPSVMSYGFRERLWILVLAGVLEVVVLILWVVMRKLERELNRK